MNIYSNFSLYDVLAILIPGGIWVVFLYLCFDNFYIKPDSHLFDNGAIQHSSDITIIGGFFLLAFSYIIGLINSCVNDCLFSCFRNNPIEISKQLKKVIDENGNIHLRDNIGCMSTNYKSTRLCQYCISIKKLQDIIKSLNCCKGSWMNENAIEHRTAYYKAYYLLSQKGLLGNIVFLETQVALLRNSIVPIFFFLISSVFVLCSPILLIIGFLIDILIGHVMVERQKKIYYLVWESANYYNVKS